MSRISRALKENRDPEDIDTPDDIPADIEDALPNEAEALFQSELEDAMDQHPDKQEGVWYAMAWDAVNDEFKKVDGKWVEREKTKEESTLDKADKLINELG